jgi:hypothetical protein
MRSSQQRQQSPHNDKPSHRAPLDAGSASSSILGVNGPAQVSADLLGAGSRRMRIHTAEVVEYATSRGPWRARRLVRPAFEEVEAALRQLDGDLHPSLGLFLDEDPPKDGVPDFEVLGGHEGYYLQATAGGSTSSYYNGSASSEPVAVWISDQGTEISAQRVCPDLERVIAAARHYCHTGELLPGFPWRPV